MAYFLKFAVTVSVAVNCFGCMLDSNSCFIEKTKPSFFKDCYIDPKGYFSIFPPVDWKVNTVSNSPLTKVEFAGPDSTTIVINTKWVGAKATRRANPKITEFNTALKIKKFIPSVSEITVNAQKTSSESYFFDERFTSTFYILHEGIQYGLIYSAKKEQTFNTHLKLALESFETFIPFERVVSDEEKKHQQIEDYRAKALLSMATKQYWLAEPMIESLLELAPNDQMGLDLKRQLDSLPEKARNFP